MVKVGMVIAINATIGVLTTFVLLGALLVTMAPDDFSFLKTTMAWSLRTFGLVVALVGMAVWLAD